MHVAEPGFDRRTSATINWLLFLRPLRRARSCRAAARADNACPGRHAHKFSPVACLLMCTPPLHLRSNDAMTAISCPHDVPDGGRAALSHGQLTSSTRRLAFTRTRPEPHSAGSTSRKTTPRAMSAFPPKKYDAAAYERLLELQSIPTIGQVWAKPAATDSAATNLLVRSCLAYVQTLLSASSACRLIRCRNGDAPRRKVLPRTASHYHAITVPPLGAPPQ